jgi:hypothetical protein
LQQLRCLDGEPAPARARNTPMSYFNRGGAQDWPGRFAHD